MAAVKKTLRNGPCQMVAGPIGHILQIQDDAEYAEQATEWRNSKLSELATVNITGALIASAVTGALSWEDLARFPWTSKSLLYSSLLVSLVSITSATQQSIVLYRIGSHEAGLRQLRRLLGDDNSARPGKLAPFVWQIPVMLLNIGIFLFVLAICIALWSIAAQTVAWDRDMKIAFVFTVASVLAVLHYGISMAYLYSKAKHA